MNFLVQLLAIAQRAKLMEIQVPAALPDGNVGELYKHSRSALINMADEIPSGTAVRGLPTGHAMGAMFLMVLLPTTDGTTPVLLLCWHAVGRPCSSSN